MRPDEHGSWEEAAAYLARVAASVLELQSGRLCDMEEDIVNQVKRYVDGHLAEDVSLVRLAEIVHFNPSYLSRFFKQLTGTNLTDYIFNAKISRAKALLADSRVKIHEAASAVGFESSTYFTKFFRRITGLNPQEYRDSIIK
jgi:two-component system response regulator YesN